MNRSYASECELVAAAQARKPGSGARRGLVVTLRVLACAAVATLAAVGSAAAASVPARTTSLPGAGSAQSYSGGESGSTGTGSAPASGSIAAPGRQFSGTFSGSDEAINYTGYVPTSYHEGNAVPLVVSLHGCTESADEFRQLSRWDQLAEARGFIVVFPEQTMKNNTIIP
jgi:poly(3-hydroxybutyrate) depolymerase